MRESAQIELAILQLENQDPAGQNIYSDIKQEIKSGHSKLLSYVSALEPYLTNEEASKRVKGLQVLVMIVKSLTISEISSKTDSTSINNDFVLGIISAIDGEKDPRNLLVVFDIIRKLVSIADISLCTKQLFDVVFCYFPIAYKSNPNDSEIISAKNLKDNLSTPLFGPLILPKLMDKIETTSTVVKEDIFRVLADGTAVYPTDDWDQIVDFLFSVIVNEVNNGVGESVSEHALTTLSSLAALSNRSDTINRAVIQTYKKINESLDVIESSKADSAIRILNSLASSSKQNCEMVSRSFIKSLIDKYNVTYAVVEKRILIDFIVTIMKSHVFYKSFEFFPQFHDDLISIFSIHSLNYSNTEYSSLFISRLSGIATLIQFENLLTPDEVYPDTMTLESIKRIIIKQTSENSDVSDLCEKLLIPLVKTILSCPENRQELSKSLSVSSSIFFRKLDLTQQSSALHSWIEALIQFTTYPNINSDHIPESYTLLASILCSCRPELDLSEVKKNFPNLVLDEYTSSDSFPDILLDAKQTT
ncbi:MMS19 nucleotide excision repair protein-like protein [Smittium culicis]|uniref:MMS19 nucleotide excision repair protein n=1 Tax=Smittium culicis TaxID=133412 RepID=A0A1R1XST6_9FUNG|nr:MMS19 nucleotide excision repair protein-like protein [Smittium culicis]